MKPLKPAQIRAIRETWGASQASFADILNVPKKTYISWESGYKSPSGAALKLLMIAKEKPEALFVTCLQGFRDESRASKAQAAASRIVESG